MTEMGDTSGRARGALNNAGWNAFATLFSITVSFLLAPLLIRHLGTDQWGLLLLVWSVTGVLGMANFGVGEAALRFVAHYHAAGDMASVNRVLGGALTFYVSVCTLVSGVVFAATPVVARWVKVPANSSYPVEWLLRLAAVLFTLGMLTNAFRSVPMAMHRYDISSRLGVVHQVARSGGFILLVLAGLGVVHLVAWDLFVAAAMLAAQAVVARRLLPGVRCWPSMSFSGFREIFGYSVYSFLTHIFLTVYREGGKLILGNRAGTASVAYLGTPDSIAYRLHMVVVSGVETLMPRFSASRDPEDARRLLSLSTWVAVTCGVALYIPLAVLMPDFLRLWINADFARESAAVGQLVAIGLIGPSAFSPIATLYRGIGKPGFVTAVMLLAGVVVLAVTLFLVSPYGAVGVGIGYALSSVVWLGGLAAGWFHLRGRSSLGALLRFAGAPLLAGCVASAAQTAVRAWWGEPGWVGLIGLGGAFAAATAAAVFATDRAFGGDSPAEYVLGRALNSARITALRSRFGLLQA